MNAAEETARLVEAYRDRCLWFLNPDYVPRSPEDILRALDWIERYGDRAGFEQAERIRKWLSHDSKPTS